MIDSGRIMLRNIKDSRSPIRIAVLPLEQVTRTSSLNVDSYGGSTVDGRRPDINSTSLLVE